MKKNEFDAASIGIGVCLEEYMKLKGWLPVSEYFEMKRKHIGLDWVEVLTLEPDGFSALPRMAEYCVNTRFGNGWYGGNGIRIDNELTTVVFFRCVENPLDHLDSYIEEQSAEVKKKSPDWEFHKDQFYGQIINMGKTSMSAYNDYVHKFD